MAGEELYSALSGLNVAPVETPYGIGAVTLAKSLPQLVNPYGSVGTNLGVVLGGTLLSSLLGYQANRQATEQSLQLGRLGSQLQTMQTPQERLSFIEGVDDSFAQRRLLGLQNALQARETAIRLGAEETQKKQEAQYAALGSPAGKQYIEAQAGLYNQKQQAAADARIRVKEAEAEKKKIELGFKTDEKVRYEKLVNELELQNLQNGMDADLARYTAQSKVNATMQDALKQAEARRRMAEIKFKSALDDEASSLPKDVREEVQDATSVSSRIFDLASRVEQMNPAEFKLYKNWDALPNSFKGEFADIAGTIGNVRYGASFTGNERKMLFDIFGDDLTTGPESFARNLRNAATALLQKAKTGVQVSQMKPVTINSMLDKMIANKSGFADMDIAAAPKAVMPEPVAADIEGVFNQLSGAPASNIAMQPKGSDLETRKQALVNKVNAAGGKVTDEDRKEAQAIAALEGR